MVLILFYGNVRHYYIHDYNYKAKTINLHFLLAGMFKHVKYRPISHHLRATDSQVVTYWSKDRTGYK